MAQKHAARCEMGGYALHKGSERVGADGSVDLQLGRLAVCAFARVVYLNLW